MIYDLITDGAAFENSIKIMRDVPPNIEKDINWITVFIAENGGRKSLLLRSLTEAGLGNMKVPLGKRSIRVEKVMDLPDRVIAISGTPLDRFPRAGTRDLRSRQRSKSYHSDQFVYLGQRAINGMSGVSQSERSLVGSLFTRRTLLKKRASMLKKIFSVLDLELILYVYLKGVVQTPIGKRSAKSNFEKLLIDPKDELIAAGLKSIDSNNHTDLFDELMLQAESLSANAAAIVITPDRVRFRQKAKIANFDLLMKIGAVEIVKTKFKRTSGDGPITISGDELSSGQWNWLSSFGGLCMELEHNTLVLVDEPENSLHPNWQRAYVPQLYDCIRNFENCQVVVATHSPLIASAVAPEWGEIRTLKRDTNKPEVSMSVNLPNAYGWSATDVYDEIFNMSSTRAPGFLEIANQALEGIAGKKISAEDAKRWSSELNKAITTLPDLDPLRQIFADIVSSLENFSSSRKYKASE